MTEVPLNVAGLRPGQRVSGLLPGTAVTIVAVLPLDDDIAEVFYRDDAGSSGQLVATEHDIASWAVITDANTSLKFDADPDQFRLASEALRIKYAALYDPMVAVNSSDVDPLPHQIRAVYEELLPRVPLRFLLADDPGAGKTIMAGLYLKELILRSDCERAIVVAPGGLVEQWREELSQKFDLHFELFSPRMVDEAQGHNAFAEHPFLIARMDQLSRNEDLMEQLEDVQWDVAIVDEAHRMSAHYSSWAGEVTETKRFALGRLLSETANNFLLMTATPHAGKEEDFQLFMSLIDKDRFEGQYRRGVHRTDTHGLMRRMVKEDLLTFEGKPLFPERRAYTVEYDLSDDERELYELVTDYVRTEMGRAERIAQAGDKKRGNNVGFALTVLQRRLASSPAAILRSLERRRERLDQKLRDMQTIAQTADWSSSSRANVEQWLTGRAELQFEADSLPSLSIEEFDDMDDETTDEERARLEAQVDEVVDRATAAQTIPELRAEIAILEDLIDVATRVRRKGEDKKWVELRNILDDQLLSHKDSGEPRKIIVFTEHRDTLDYLQSKISAQLGRADAVVTIHGGVRREDRKVARERFTHNPDTVVLLATDAAGEGLNLQRAHLMVNYDLPWNPNRIEQRFGRIHRIGQREVCHLWNLVARDTREGAVFKRLLTKIDEMARAYNGNLFNVLGDSDAFQERSLRDLLIEAIRYGDQPHVKANLERIIDAGISQGLGEMLEERALHPDMFNTLDLKEVRQRMEEARERKLQPGYISAFFIPAFERLGGRIRKRESGRYEITRVPPRVISIARRSNRWLPVPEQYERVTFRLDKVHPDGLTRAALIAPGHPLLDAVIEATIEDLGHTLKQGTVFIDRRSRQSAHPTLMFTVEQQIRSGPGNSNTVSHHFDYASLSPDCTIDVSSAPGYLDYEPATEDELRQVDEVLQESWLRENHERQVRTWAYKDGMRPRMDELVARQEIDVRRTRAQVKDRLLAEINHWDREHSRLEELERKGTVGRLRAKTASKKAHDLERRLSERLQELDRSKGLVPQPALIRGTALIIPSSLVADEGDEERVIHTKETRAVERRAVEAVMAAERSLGRTPVEMAQNNKGYDIRSTDRDGAVYFIEVKGRIEGSETFSITVSEVTHAQTHAGRHRLALVEVSKDGAAADRLRYVVGSLDHISPSVTTRSYNELWKEHWDRGGPPW